MPEEVIVGGGRSLLLVFVFVLLTRPVIGAGMSGADSGVTSTAAGSGAGVAWKGTLSPWFCCW